MGSRACRYTEPQWGVTVSGCNYPASTPGSTNRGDLAARPLRTVPALPPRKTRHSPTRTHLQNHTVARIVAPSHRLDLVQIAGKRSEERRVGKECNLQRSPAGEIQHRN